MKNKEIKRQQAIKAANDARAQELKAEVNKLKSKKMFQEKIYNEVYLGIYLNLFCY